MGIGSHTETLSVGGRLMQRAVDGNADSEGLYGGAASPITLAAGKAAADWVKTDANTAACNFAANHGLTNCTADAWWNGGLRYGVGLIITGNAGALEGGTGTDFPANATNTVVVAPQQQVNVSIDGDLAKFVGVSSTVPAHVTFQDVNAATINAVTLVANEPEMWDSNMASTPYTGAPITKAQVTNGTLAWVTSKAYVVGDVRTQSSLFYKCLIAHTSATFATDLAAGDWTAVSATFECIVLQDSTP